MSAFFKNVPRLGAALAFVAASITGVVATTPAPASAAVSIGVGVNVGGVHAGFASYPRWRWGGHAWVRSGYYYGRPGYLGTVGYIGYAPPLYGPVAYAPYYYHPRPYYYGYRPYYRPYFVHGYYGHGYYGRGYYGRGYYRGYRR